MRKVPAYFFTWDPTIYFAHDFYVYFTYFHHVKALNGPHITIKSKNF